jgi:hypothetical protein
MSGRRKRIAVAGSIIPDLEVAIRKQGTRSFLSSEHSLTLQERTTSTIDIPHIDHFPEKEQFNPSQCHERPELLPRKHTMLTTRRKKFLYRKHQSAIASLCTALRQIV